MSTLTIALIVTTITIAIVGASALYGWKTATFANPAAPTVPEKAAQRKRATSFGLYGFAASVIIALLVFLIALVAKTSGSAPQPATPAPAATEVPVPPTIEHQEPSATPLPLTIAEFQSMWSKTPTDNPGPLMRKLDTWYDTQAKALQVATWQYGFQSEVGEWKAVPGSLVWTDTKDLWFTTVDGSALDDGDVVKLRCQGNWCVYAVYDNVIVPTPGRMAVTDRWLDPAVDLQGWQ